MCNARFRGTTFRGTLECKVDVHVELRPKHYASVLPEGYTNFFWYDHAHGAHYACDPPTKGRARSYAAMVVFG